jgi:hypothetical protein
MTNSVKHGKRYYKQMALEVAVRNPERYEEILRTFSKYDGKILDDEGILEIYSQLYLDGAISANGLDDSRLTAAYMHSWIKDNCSHNNEWGFPTGYQAAFTRYLKTLSEFGFIYSQYKQRLRLSPIAKAMVSGKITISEAFATQSMRFWRKSPYRRVLNDFNFFEFIVDSMLKLKESGRFMSYNQFLVGLFSDDGDVDSYLQLLADNKVGADIDKAYALVFKRYSQIDAEHSKVAKLQSAFRDYGNTVFRVLQLTGFITVDNKGVLMLSPNSSRMDFYKALKSMKFAMPETAKEDELEYFEILGSFDSKLEKLVISFREKEDATTAEYNTKLPRLIESYHLTKELIEEALLKVSAGDTRGKDVFWFIQDPVKFEFLLTLYAYCNFGDNFEYKPNFICDEAGIPYSHAPGNIGDIEIFNKDLYWLIEATLIRGKNQQVNNETVNLFRHVDKERVGSKYLTLVAPYIHDDTKLIFNVASVITMIQNNMVNLFSTAQTTENFVDEVKSKIYFPTMRSKTREFIIDFREKLNSISTL